jgi:hypothetical protein
LAGDQLAFSTKNSALTHAVRRTLICPYCPKQSSNRVAEVVPSDDFSSDIGPDGREQEIAIAEKAALVLPASPRCFAETSTTKSVHRGR